MRLPSAAKTIRGSTGTSPSCGRCGSKVSMGQLLQDEHWQWGKIRDKRAIWYLHHPPFKKIHFWVLPACSLDENQVPMGDNGHSDGSVTELFYQLPTDRLKKPEQMTTTTKLNWESWSVYCKLSVVQASKKDSKVSNRTKRLERCGWYRRVGPYISQCSSVRRFSEINGMNSTWSWIIKHSHKGHKATPASIPQNIRFMRLQSWKKLRLRFRNRMLLSSQCGFPVVMDMDMMDDGVANVRFRNPETPPAPHGAGKEQVGVDSRRQLPGNPIVLDINGKHSKSRVWRYQHPTKKMTEPWPKHNQEPPQHSLMCWLHSSNEMQPAQSHGPTKTIPWAINVVFSMALP